MILFLFLDVEKAIFVHRWNLEKERKLARNLLERCETRATSTYPSNYTERVNPPFTSLVSRNRRHSLETKSWSASVANDLHEIKYRLSEMSNMFSQYLPPQKCSYDFASSYYNLHGEPMSLDRDLPSAAARWCNSENESPFSEHTSDSLFTSRCEKDWRSSLGLGAAKSPTKKGKSRKLVETTSSEALSNLDEDFGSVSTSGADKKNGMSLESIALIVNGTASPRSVIDQLLLLHKKIRRNEELDDEGIGELQTDYQTKAKGYEMFLSNHDKFSSLDAFTEKLVPSRQASREMGNLISCLKIDVEQTNRSEKTEKVQGYYCCLNFIKLQSKDLYSIINTFMFCIFQEES